MWERSILRRCELPAAVRNPTGTYRHRYHANLYAAPAFEKVFQTVYDAGLWPLIITWNGTYCFRMIRGGKRLSLHSFGLAVDLNAATNRLGTDGDMPPKLVEVFTSLGWRWGGHFRRPDPMHFQYARGC